MKQVDGRTKVGGLMGNPVEHTLSPLIHNTLAADLEHNFIYVPFLVAQGDEEAAVRGAYALGLQGMNVTVPYKSAVIPYLKEIDSLAEKIGAVNTLVRREGGFKGYNTDMTGLLRAMKADGVELLGETVVILGAGGAARSVAFLCAHAGAKRIYLLNRTLERAKQVAAEVNAAFEADCIKPLLLEQYKELPEQSFLAIQGTSVGLYPNTEDAVISDDAFYERVHTGYDLIYRPNDTKFMRLVREHGGKAYNGLKMLAYQGILAYELWNQASISDTEAERIIGILEKEIGQ